MRIHHFTVPAQDPTRVAGFLAELLGAKIVPSPHPKGSLLVYSGDDDGSCIEVWPAATRGRPGDTELGQSELPLPEAWPHHGYLTTDASEPEQILAAFAREGWKAEMSENGPPHARFTLVRGWIENHTTIEIGGKKMREEYERFFREVIARAAAAAE